MPSSVSPATFDRPVYALLGLPIDAVTLDQACAIVENASATGQRCFLTTPNLNFLITSHTDRAFLDSVIDSDLVIADGMPLVRVAGLFGIPITERVAGSTLIERIRHGRPQVRPMRVFFFGGPEGVADKACEVLRAEHSGLAAAGAHYPGFGAFSDMIAPEVMDEINATDADMVLVALGAKKGQAWIQAARHQLRAPVISHLGAVVNFIAGTVARAPVWMQKSGLEWVWRIWEEPTLYKRYYQDGKAYLRLLRQHVLPLRRLERQCAAQVAAMQPAQVKARRGDTGLVISVDGRATERDLPPVREAFKATLSAPAGPIELDLSACQWLDPAFLGLVMLLLKVQRERGHALRVTGANLTVRELMTHHHALYLLD